MNTAPEFYFTYPFDLEKFLWEGSHSKDSENIKITGLLPERIPEILQKLRHEQLSGFYVSCKNTDAETDGSSNGELRNPIIIRGINGYCLPDGIDPDFQIDITRHAALSEEDGEEINNAAVLKARELVLSHLDLSTPIQIFSDDG